MKKTILRSNNFLFLAIASILFLSSFPANAEKFEFKYNEGETYRILSTVNEDVLVNGNLHHKAEIINRISVKVTNVDSNGAGVHEAHFMTSEKSVGNGSNALYTWGEEYESKFSRSKNGVYTISDEYFMPVVRDVPVFPDRDLKIGDTWSYEGHEAHDLRGSFGVFTPFKVPFTANYAYYGDTEKDGVKYQIIKANYRLYYDSPKPANPNVEYPASTQGFSDQTILWDNEKGMIRSYSERFRIQIETNFGDIFVFKGRATAEVTDIASVKNAETIAKVKEQISELGIENTDVKANDKGITISIENIQFKADSAILQASEQAKLKKISEILKAFPDNDLLVVGHTALAGTPESCQALSEERANSVADYLVKQGTKDRKHIFTQGKGASEPIAPNTTANGMAKNRRVEITIMEQ